MRTITKKLIRDERGILVDPEAAFRFTPAPVPEVPREVLAELLQPGMIPATGSFEPRYAPITEGVPDIPERPTVTVEQLEAEPNAASMTMVLAILLGAIAAGLLIGYGLWAGVVSLRGF